VTSGIHCVGDVMYDVLLQVLPRLTGEAALLAEVGVTPGRYALATVHRASNTDDPATLRAIFGALAEVAGNGLPVVVPLHPRTRKALAAAGVPEGPLKLLPPQSYERMLLLQRRAAVVLTDSGGVQKEALWLGVPCVTLRAETEWVETVACGWNVLVGTDPARIVAAALTHRPGGQPPACLGDGHAAERIVQVLAEALA
jgi:UDP-N-acetylglucosamine 2-epimerase